MSLELELDLQRGQSDPYPLYGRLRQKDPVHWSSALEGWVVTRYCDVKSILLDPRFSARRRISDRFCGRHENPRWKPNLALRGLESMPIRVEA